MPRSGTSLLSGLLHAHSELAIAPETHYFTRCWKGPLVKDETHAQRLLDCLLQQPGVEDMAFSATESEAVKQAVQAAERPSHRVILTALLDTYARKHHAVYWGEKTPAHLEHVESIAQVFPEAVFLVVMRDPRDVSLSLRKVPWNHKRTVLDHAARWAHYARMVQAYSQDASINVEVIHYERLIQAPEAVLRDLCAVLEAEYEPAMLAGRRPDDANVDPGREPWKKKALQPIDPTNKEKWKDNMEAFERKVVQWKAGAEMEMWGYPVEEVPWTLGMSGDVLRLLGQLLGKQWHRLQLHGVTSTSPLDMPWRSAAGGSD